jgi:hypothetical protein
MRGRPSCPSGSRTGREKPAERRAVVTFSECGRDGHRDVDENLAPRAGPSATPPRTGSGVISTLPRKRVALFWFRNPRVEALDLAVGPVVIG